MKRNYPDKSAKRFLKKIYAIIHHYILVVQGLIVMIMLSIIIIITNTHHLCACSLLLLTNSPFNLRGRPGGVTMCWYISRRLGWDTDTKCHSSNTAFMTRNCRFSFLGHHEFLEKLLPLINIKSHMRASRTWPAEINRFQNRNHILSSSIKRPFRFILVFFPTMLPDFSVIATLLPSFLSDPCAHGVRSLGRLVSIYVFLYGTFLKPCEDLVKTINVVNVVKT